MLVIVFFFFVYIRKKKKKHKCFIFNWLWLTTSGIVLMIGNRVSCRPILSGIMLAVKQQIGLSFYCTLRDNLTVSNREFL